MPKKTILLLISGLGPGGAERIFHSLAVQLSRKHRVIECIYNLKDQVYPFATSEQVILTPKEANNAFQKAVFLLTRIYRLWKLKRRLKPDICISQLESCDYLNILTRQRHERTICLIQCSMIFNHDIRGYSAWLRKKVLMPITYQKAHAIVTVSWAIKQEFEIYFRVVPEKIHVIYNFADFDEVVHKSKEPLQQGLADIFENCHCFVTAGRLTAQKNQGALISVFSEIKRRSQIKVKLFILGDGELRDKLAALAIASNLAVYKAWDNGRPSADYDLFLLGFDSNPFKFFSRAKWFVFSSLWEGLPLVLVEAMAAGVPIISSDCPTGPADILTDVSPTLNFVKEPTHARFGILMPMIIRSDPKVIDQWCTEITSLCQNDETRRNYVQLIPQRVAEFTIERAIAKWDELLENCGK